MTRKFSMAAALLALAACDPGPKTPPPPPPPTTSAAKPAVPPGGLMVTLDDTPWPMTSAIATGFGPARLVLTLSTHALACDAAERPDASATPRSGDRRALTPTSGTREGGPDASATPRSGEGGPDTIALTLVRELGGEQWRLSHVEAKTAAVTGASSFKPQSAPLAKLLEADLGGTVRVSLDDNVPIGAASGAVRMEIEGELRATGCGQATAAGERQNDLSVSLAGEFLPIHSATFASDATGYRVELATSPNPCGAAGDADAELIVEIDKVGRHVTSVALRGARLGDLGSAPVPEGVIKATIKGGSKSDDVELSGKVTLFDKYPLELSGTAHAMPCASNQ